MIAAREEAKRYERYGQRKKSVGVSAPSGPHENFIQIKVYHKLVNPKSSNNQLWGGISMILKRFTRWMDKRSVTRRKAQN